MAAQRPIDNLRHEADVYTSDGKKVGKLHAVVVDPGDNEVTQLAVNTGPFFPAIGFGDPKIVSVDVEQLTDANEERVDLAISNEVLSGLPLYEHRHFFAVPEHEEHSGPRVTRLWDAGTAVAAALAGLGSGIAVPAEHVLKAGFERTILNDSPVWRQDPHTHIGEVERVIVDEATDEMQALVIRRGVFFPEDVILPMRYVTEINDGVIRVQISNEEIERLEEYRGE